MNHSIKKQLARFRASCFLKLINAFTLLEYLKNLLLLIFLLEYYKSGNYQIAPKRNRILDIYKPCLKNKINLHSATYDYCRFFIKSNYLFHNTYKDYLFINLSIIFLSSIITKELIHFPLFKSLKISKI